MKIIPTLFVTSALLIAGCKPSGSTAAAPDAAKDAGADAVATIDGKTISRSTYDFFIRAATGKTSADLSPEQRQEALDSLIRLQLTAAQAEKDGLAKDKDTAAALDLSRLDVLQRAEQQRYLKDKTPSEQELRAEYDAQVALMPHNEFRASHILVKEESTANDILARLKKGEKFEAVAAKDSLDATKQKGGDLGWFTPQTMVKPFSDAVLALKKGETTSKPVQTQYGWHIIRLDDTRDVQPPPFDQVKGQLTQVVLGKKFKAYSDELLKAAKVERKL
jgi:peptidyl-prolyl cis-trans isomerase C